MTPAEDVDPARSELMRRVRRSGTAPELVVAKALRRLGHSYRLNVRSLPGSPDFANKSRRWAIFVHGCFWHHHTNCKRATVPKRNAAFWIEKFGRNRGRDAKAVRALRKAGYRVAVIWECETATVDRPAEALRQFLEPRRVGVAEPIDHGRIAVDVAGDGGRGG